MIILGTKSILTSNRLRGWTKTCARGQRSGQNVFESPNKMEEIFSCVINNTHHRELPVDGFQLFSWKTKVKERHEGC